MPPRGHLRSLEQDVHRRLPSVELGPVWREQALFILVAAAERRDGALIPVSVENSQTAQAEEER